jgi:hypothetical protein
MLPHKGSNGNGNPPPHAGHGNGNGNSQGVCACCRFTINNELPPKFDNSTRSPTVPTRSPTTGSPTLPTRSPTLASKSPTIPTRSPTTGRPTVPTSSPTFLPTENCEALPKPDKWLCQCKRHAAFDGEEKFTNKCSKNCGITAPPTLGDARRRSLQGQSGTKAMGYGRGGLCQCCASLLEGDLTHTYTPSAAPTPPTPPTSTPTVAPSAAPTTPTLTPTQSPTTKCSKDLSSDDKFKCKCENFERKKGTYKFDRQCLKACKMTRPTLAPASSDVPVRRVLQGAGKGGICTCCAYRFGIEEDNDTEE